MGKSGHSGGVRLKKSLGQHFLTQPNVARRMAEAASIGPDDLVLEIGPGAGALTRFLAEARPRMLAALEKDGHWAKEIKRLYPDVRVMNADAMHYDYSLLDQSWPGVKVMGNLPYNVASPIIWDVASQCSQATLAVFMIQQEVAKRIASGPSCKEYGALSVWVQAHCAVKYLFRVPPGSFQPPPKVDSGVILLRPRPLQERPKHAGGLRRVLHVLFSKRRKQLGGILRELWDDSLDNLLKRKDISPTLRPENLSVQDFVDLGEWLEIRATP